MLSLQKERILFSKTNRNEQGGESQNLEVLSELSF